MSILASAVKKLGTSKESAVPPDEAGGIGPDIPESQARALRSPAAIIGADVLLEVSRVSKRFVTSRHDTLALDDISLEIRQGEFLCVVGPSGCGKSTLLNLIAGLDQPTSGDLVFDGRPVRDAGAERVVVFQEAALYPWLNVRSNVEFGLKLKGTPRAERRDIVDSYLELVNLTRFEKAFVHELSGGMKQRVQLARALAVEPRMLLMDEPFAALDAQTRDTLQMELQEIWARTGATIFFITHNVREAALLGDRVLVMTQGPGRIKAELAVNLPRPREIDTHALVDYATEVRAALQNEAYTARAGEPRFAI
jgi:NitT/TauT family transport system ATP-binding protein